MATIKKGTYRLNDEITFPSGVDALVGTFNFSCDGKIEYDSEGVGYFISEGTTDFTEFKIENSSRMLYYKPSTSVGLLIRIPAYWDEYKWDGFYSAWQDGDESLKGFGQTIHVEADSEVSEEFYTWFTANAVEQKTFVIKAGTYKFNDVVTIPEMNIYQTINFFVTDAPNHSLLGISVGDFGNYEDHFYRVYYTPFVVDTSYGIVYSDGAGWASSDYGVDLQTVTVTEDTEVSAKFYEWCTANAVEVSNTVTLKAGTYRFNDVLTGDFDNLSQDITFEYNYEFVVSQDEVAKYNAILGELGDVVATTYNVKTICTWMGGTEVETFGYRHSEAVTTPVSVGLSVLFSLNSSYDGSSTHQFHSDEWRNEGAKTITIPNDTEVSAEFLTWFTANTVEQKQLSGIWKWTVTECFIGSVPAYNFDKTDESVLETVFKEYGVKIQPTYANWDGYLFVVLGLTADLVYNDIGEAAIIFQCQVGDDIGYATLDDHNAISTLPTINFGTEPQYVSVEFYNWLTENASEILPIATVAYNGKTIAMLLDYGNVATLKCEGKVMKSDIVATFTDDCIIIYNGVRTNGEAGKTATLKCNGKVMKSDVVFDTADKSVYCGLSFKTQPKTAYKQNEWIEDCKLWVHYDDGTVREIDLISDDVIVRGFNTSELGSHTVTVKYVEGGELYTLEYTITVTE